MSDESDAIVYRWDGPPRLELHRRPVPAPDGTRRFSHALITQGGVPGVVVVALQEARVLLVEHPRPWAGGTLLELPRGFGEPADGEPGSDVAAGAAARRELREETGYEADAVEVIGRYHPDSALLPGAVAVVRARVRLGAVPGATDGETDGCLWLPLADVPAAVRYGRLRDGHSLAALALLGAARG
ncbi:MAG: NUDIX hydrolase [Amnibacterium sp.]